MPGEDFIQAQLLPLYAGPLHVVMSTATVNGAASSATQTFNTTTGFEAGDTIYFETTGAERTILSVNSATQVTLTATISTTNGETVRHNRYIDLATCGNVQLDGQGAYIYLRFSDIYALEQRMWIFYNRGGSNNYRILCEDESTFNDGVAFFSPTALGDAFLIQVFGGKLYAWSWTAVV